MKLFFNVICMASLLLGSTATYAQSPGTWQDVTKWKFEDDIVEGTLVRPDGIVEVIRTTGHSRSLVKVRGHFVPEMLKSVEDI